MQVNHSGAEDQEGGCCCEEKKDDHSSVSGDSQRTWQARRKSRETKEELALMPAENPNEPNPDDIPEDERTGDEPNPSGKSGKSKAPNK